MCPKEAHLTINVLEPPPDWRAWERPKALGGPLTTFLEGSFKGEEFFFFGSLDGRPLGEWEGPSGWVGWPFVEVDCGSWYWAFKRSKSTTVVRFSDSDILLFWGNWSTREHRWKRKRGVAKVQMGLYLCLVAETRIFRRKFLLPSMSELVVE